MRLCPEIAALSCARALKVVPVRKPHKPHFDTFLGDM
jgi:hypothetical protein